MARATTLKTTSCQEVRKQPRVKAFLAKKARNSQGTAEAYLLGLAKMQEFLNLYYSGASINEVVNLINSGSVNVYELLDAFTDYLITKCGLATTTNHAYMAAVKSYLEDYDVEISPSKYRKKVVIPKNHREDEFPINDQDIRKMLLASTSPRLRLYLLILASSGVRAAEALSIRLKDIDFNVIPTKIHLRKEYTKTKVARDVYISEEATTALKQFIERKYTIPIQRTGEIRPKSDDDLLFRMIPPELEEIQKQKDREKEKKGQRIDLSGVYNKLMLRFQQLLTITGLDERKERVQQQNRRKISFHSFRRFFMSVANNKTSSEFAHFLLGHSSKSPYYVQTEPERRLLYATKIMPFVTFTDYSKLDADADMIQTEVERLQMENAKKDREIEQLKLKIEHVSQGTDDIKELKEKTKEYDSFMTHLKPSIEEFQREIKSLKLQINSETTKKTTKTRSK